MKSINNIIQNEIVRIKNLPARIVVKFHDDLQIQYKGKSGAIDSFTSNSHAREFFSKSFPPISINRLFTSVTTEELNTLVNKARQLDASYQPPDLLSYFVIDCPEEINPDTLLQKLSRFEEVELAYLQSRATNPPATHSIDRTIFSKGYLNPSPEGINSKYAWRISGGKGMSNVKFIDIEQGWILNHEAIDVKTLPLTGFNDPVFGDHGTAVLGVIMMKENGTGGIGITPDVSSHVISQWRPDGKPNDADAVLAAITYLNFGDILLLETQSFYSGRNNKLWPAEIQDAAFQAIRLATALGIIVIEAAGNGEVNNFRGNDLDLVSVNKKRVLDPMSNDFRDSGAIIVAAATADLPHHRISSSNYGQRINCYAWGEGVATAGNYPASSGPAINTYTFNFAGTSSAAAIIAGVAISIQSILEARHITRFSPKQMRNILSSDVYGTPSANGHRKDKIGVMPDLKKIIDNCLNDPHCLPAGETN